MAADRGEGSNGVGGDGEPLARCPACGAGLAARQRFCTACGTAVARVCGACGTTNATVARFCGQCGAVLTPSVPIAQPLPEPPVAPRHALPPAERRQLSVLFCDLAESTALSARLDPEDLRAVIGAYHQTCAEVIGAAGGFVAKYLGDGVLAYFGYPRAQENNAEQAVRAGLGLVEAVGALAPPAAPGERPSPLAAGKDGPGWPLRVRVGIASGMVVVGDLVGEGAAQERMVVGQTPNLAARLQEIASPGEVVIAEATRRLVGGMFEYRDLEPIRLKGFTGNVAAFAVLGPSLLESRFRARQETGVTPLCGRQHELARLLELWQRARAGEGRAVLIVGEAGIGKSRLISELLDAIAGTPHIRLRCSGLPYYENSAFHPLVAYLEFAAAFARGDTPAQKLEKLEALLRPSEASAEEVALIADLLSLPHPGRERLAGLSPQRRKEKTLEAFLARTECLAQRHPVLSVWEDLHWMDPSSLEYLGARVAHTRSQPSLVVMTARPGFSAPWLEQSEVILLPLARLGQKETESLIASVAGERTLPDELQAQMVARADGVPLFIEELTKSILESGLLREQGGRFVASALEARLAIPETLHDSLAARLDRLSPWREVVQIGAALGREFPYDLLSAVAGLADARLREALDELVRSELVFCRGTAPNATYTFKHALVQDAAIGMMLRGDRQRLHSRIVAVLEEKFPDIVMTHPERLGRHCLEAGLFEKAIGYWLTASRHALARSTTEEAIALLRKGLGLLPKVAEPARREQLELDLQIGLGQALSAARGYADAEADRAFARARELCDPVNRPTQLVPVLYGQFLLRYHRLDMDWVRERGEEACRLGEAANDPILQWLGHRMCGSRLASIGEFAAARAHLEQCLAFSDAVDSKSGGTLPPEGPNAGTLFHLCRVLCCLGFPDQARSRVRELMLEARRRRNFALFHGLSGACIVDWCLRSATSAALRDADELLSVSAEQGWAQGRAWGNLFRGRCIALMGRLDEAIPVLTNGLAEYRRLRIKVGLPMFLASLAEVYGMAGRLQEGLALLSDAELPAEAEQNRWQWAEALRIRGTLLSAAGDFEAAEHSFHQALVLARRQEARLWELRSAVDLARIWRARGRRDDAHEMLAPLVAWFTEGADLDDLRQAKEMLSREVAA